jgi:hypothetical protein
MGTTFTKYNPTTAFGQYNLKNDAYTNRRNLLIVLGVILLITAAVMVLVWSEDGVQTQGNFNPYSIPPAQYGTGPYGTGVYLPHENLLAESLAYT